MPQWKQVQFKTNQSIYEYYADIVKDHQWDKDSIDDKEQINNAVKASMIKSSLTDADTRRFHKTSKDVWITNDYNDISTFLNNNNNWDLTACNNECHIVSPKETMASIAAQYNKSEADFITAISADSNNAEVLKRYKSNKWFQVGDKISLPFVNVQPIQPQPSLIPAPTNTSSSIAPVPSSPPSLPISILSDQDIDFLIGHEIMINKKNPRKVVHLTLKNKADLQNKDLSLRITKKIGLDQQLDLLSTVNQLTELTFVPQLITEMPDLRQLNNVSKLNLLFNKVRSKFDANLLPSNLKHLELKGIELETMPDLSQLPLVKLNLTNNNNIGTTFNQESIPASTKVLILPTTNLAESVTFNKLTNLTYLDLAGNSNLNKLAKEDIAAKLPKNKTVTVKMPNNKKVDITGTG